MIPDAILAMIKAAVPAVTVYDGMVPGTPDDRYAVLYIDDGTRSALSARGTADSTLVRFQVTAVAPDRGRAHWIASTIKDAILDIKPSAAGWSCGPIEHTFSEPPSRDEAVMARPVVVQVDLYKVRASRV